MPKPIYHKQKIRKNNFTSIPLNGLTKNIHYITRKVLNLPSNHDITYHDLYILKKIFSKLMYGDGLSPKNIQNKFSIDIKSCLGVFMKRTLKIKSRNFSDAAKNYRKNIGDIPEKRRQYRLDANFKFSPYIYPNIPGYDLLLERGMYHPTKNPDGMTRDHILSIEYGYRNNIDPELLKHPANCQFLTMKENAAKGTKYGMIENELKERIKQWNYDNIKPANTSYKKLPKTEEQKIKISESLKGKRSLRKNIIPDIINILQIRKNYTYKGIGREFNIHYKTARKYINLAIEEMQSNPEKYGNYIAEYYDIKSDRLRIRKERTKQIEEYINSHEKYSITSISKALNIRKNTVRELIKMVPLPGFEPGRPI